jgi:CelD/BcsL family acetyltransferase involved in cellulose biosynthesis
MAWVKGELLDSLSEADRLGAEQLSRAAQTSLFDRLDWLKRVWAHTPPAPRLLIARAQRERGFAWLFLAIDDQKRALGLSNWYNFSTHPIFAGEADDASRRAMLVAIARRLKPGLGRITISPIAEAGAELMQSAFSKAGWFATSHQCSTRWIAHVKDKNFATYWDERPGQLRNTFKRKSGKSEIVCSVFTSFDEAAWDAYEAVYAQSWKPEEGSPAFLRDMAMTESEAGCLRLAIARMDGEPVAAQLWTVENDTALIHKLAYRSDLRDLSPGTILSEAIFRHVIDDDKVAIIDFGTGDDGYKKDWMDEAEPLMEVRLYNPLSLDGFLGMAKAKLSRLAGR